MLKLQNYQGTSHSYMYKLTWTREFCQGYYSVLCFRLKIINVCSLKYLYQAIYKKIDTRGQVYTFKNLLVRLANSAKDSVQCVSVYSPHMTSLPLPRRY